MTYLSLFIVVEITKKWPTNYMTINAVVKHKIPILTMARKLIFHISHVLLNSTSSMILHEINLNKRLKQFKCQSFQLHIRYQIYRVQKHMLLF